MKHLKKILALVSVLLLIVSSSLVLTSSAATTSVNNFNPLLRYWHYGAYPDTVTYTSGGYATLASTHYARQHQVCFYGQPLKEEWSAFIKESIKSGKKVYIDVNVADCHGTKKDEEPEQVSPEINIIIKYKYKDSSGSIEAGETQQTKAVGKIEIGSTATLDFGFTDIQMDEDFTAYDSIEVTFVKIAVQNYACLANEATGDAGCGEFNITFSPFYLEGSKAPEKGKDLGENFNPDDYAWESADKITSIPEVGVKTPDGPFKGGVDLKRNSSYVPYLADGVTLATVKPVQTTTTTKKPTTTACKHAKKTTKVTKAATYFAAGVKTTYCASCRKALSKTTIAKKTLAKPSIKATGAKKSVKITWKKVSGATGYVVEMKSGKKYKVVKTITKGKTTSFTKKGLKKGRKYSFRVKAVVKSGSKKAYSKYSSVKTAKAK